MKMIINWRAVGALFISIAALASHPEFLGILSKEWSLGLTILGFIGQALTGQVARVPVERKDDT